MDPKTFTQDEVDTIVQTRLERDRRVRVTSEPRTYALDSPHSFFNDAATVTLDPDARQHMQAHQRMLKWGSELAHEVEARSAEGRYIERVMRNQTRVPDEKEHRSRFGRVMKELRALGTGGGSTAAAASSASVFVSPYFLLDEWAPYRGINRAFSDQCHNLPIPDYGMQIYVPAWTSAAGAAQQTEGNAATESDPASTLQNGAVVTITGKITGSQQFSDRGGSGAGWSDAVLHRQLCEQLEQSIDAYVIGQALAAAGTTVLNNSAWTANNLKDFLNDVAQAEEGLTDTAGTRLRPTHLFSTSDFYLYVSHLVDGSGRPLLPQSTLPVPTAPRVLGADDGQQGQTQKPWWSRFTGQILPGSVYWFTDDNIPASGADTQVIVSAPDQSVILLESPDPVFSVFPQTVANQLQIVFNLRSYVSTIVRHAGGVSIISGGAYPSSNK